MTSIFKKIKVLCRHLWFHVHETFPFHKKFLIAEKGSLYYLDVLHTNKKNIRFN